jgi:hypothetical protein
VTSDSRSHLRTQGDPHTPIEETMGALHEVLLAGKARYLIE